MSNWLSVLVPKDLANRWTNMVLIYSISFEHVQERLITILGRVPPPCQEKSYLEKMESKGSIYTNHTQQLSTNYNCLQRI